MKTADFLRTHDACCEGAKWALSVSSDMSAVWDALVDQGKHEWLLWTVTRLGVFPESILRKLACRFVRETPLSDGRMVWDLLTDERSRQAVEVAEAYVDGKATESELSAAAAEASWASYDAAHAAASYAATAAYSAAAYAAARAAYYAARAADAAYYAARAADVAAYAARAAKSAQINMIAELGNPFQEELARD